jgi:hypothetical protein
MLLTKDSLGNRYARFRFTSANFIEYLVCISRPESAVATDIFTCINLIVKFTVF